MITECSRPEGDRLGTNSTYDPCQGHLSGQRSSGPWSLFSAMGLLVPYKFRALYSFFPRSGWGVAGPEGRWRRGGRESFPFGRLLRPLSCSRRFRAPKRPNRRRLHRAAGAELSVEAQQSAEAWGWGVNVHRLSVPTRRQVALQGGPVFTCLLSQVAQTRAPFRSAEPGGGPGVSGLPHPHFPTLRPYAPCWGRGRSKQGKPGRQEGDFGN